MKIDYRDIILTSLGLTLTLTLTLLLLHVVDPLLEASSGKLYALVYFVCFLLTYGVATSSYLSVLVRIWPLREGVHKMSSFQFKLWMHTAVMGNIAKASLSILNNDLTRALYFRILGVKLGKGVMIGRVNITDPKLLNLQDGAIIGDGSSLAGHMIAGNRIIIKKMNIGKNATVGAHSIIKPGLHLGENSIIAPLSRVEVNITIPPNEFWDGIPAKKVKDIKKIGAKGTDEELTN